MNLLSVGYEKVSVTGWLTPHLFDIYADNDIYLYRLPGTHHYMIGNALGEIIAYAGESIGSAVIMLSTRLENMNAAAPALNGTGA